MTDTVLIGRGASSSVYRALDVDLHRPVAVKVLLADDPRDPARRRFEREREITANLGRHPHIVQVLGTGFTGDGLPYVVMELFEQGSIGDHLQRHGTFSPTEVIDIGSKIADAVVAAHRAGVLHRDIKPQNILLSEYGPALADFGIARSVVNHEWSQSLDQLTPMHAAPEVLEGADPSPGCDIYSLGSTLYTMLAGRPPFAGPPGESVLALHLRVLQSPLPPLPRSDVPPALIDILERAMEKDPTVRYPSALAMRQDLERARLGLSSPASPGPSGPPVANDAPSAAIGHRDPSGPLVAADRLVVEDLGDADTTDVARRRIQPVPGTRPDPQPRAGGPPVEHLGPLVDVRGAGDVRSAAEPDLTSVRLRTPSTPVVAAEPAHAHRRTPLAIAAAILLLAAIVGSLTLLGTTSHGGQDRTPPQARSVGYTTAGAPSNVSVTPLDAGNAVEVRWSDLTGGSASFELLETSDQPAKLVGIASAGVSSKVIPGINPGAPYCFIVNALLPSGKLAPGCACINGGKLTSAPPGFPAHVCPS